MPIPLFWLVAFGGYAIYKALSEEDTPQKHVPPPIEDIVCLVGRAGSGKSSTANALLGYNAFIAGAEHGSTSESFWIDYQNGYKLLDTPGLLDKINYKFEVITQLWRSRIIVYVTSGQLYQQELDFLEEIYSNYLTSHKVILFVNKQDIAENTMPSSQRNNERQAIIRQVSHCISPENIVFGSASPKQNGKELSSQISELKNLINKIL